MEHLDAVLVNYEFIEPLGQGGMGAVYKARQPSIDRLVAIKILPKELGVADPLLFERFKREAQSMARLGHPNIVQVYDFGQTTDGHFYFVMEYVDGSDLSKLIRTGELTPDHVFGWLPQVCAALQYSHDRGIIHRDIKPGNLLVDRQGTVKITDFGLAKLSTGESANRLTMTNVALGTPDYLAPEALDDEIDIDHRADLYALGIIIYEMLTGKRPRGVYKNASELRPGLDPRFDALIDRAMDADPARRQQQAAEIARELEAIRTAAMPPQPALPATRTPETKSAPAISNPRSGSTTSRGRPLSRSVPRQRSGNAFLVWSLIGTLTVLGAAGFLWKKSRPDQAIKITTETTTATVPATSNEIPAPAPKAEVTAPEPAPAVTQTPEPSPSVEEISDPSELRSRLLADVSVLNFGQSIPGILEITGPLATPILSANTDQTFLAVADPPDPTLPRLALFSHGSLLQMENLEHSAGLRQLLDNLLQWMSPGETTPVLISAPEAAWNSAEWARNQGYEVVDEPPPSGGGILILHYKAAILTPAQRERVHDRLPTVDGVIFALTPWNFQWDEGEDHPANEILAPFDLRVGRRVTGRLNDFAISGTPPPPQADHSDATIAEPPASTPPSPSAPAGPPPFEVTLAKITAEHERRYRDEHLSLMRNRVGDLNERYLGAVEREQQKLAAEGNLDIVLPYAEEAERVQKGAPLPETDADLPAPLATLRGFYREQLKDIQKDHTAELATHAGALESELAKLSEETENSPVDARLLQSLRTALESGRFPFPAAPDVLIAIVQEGGTEQLFSRPTLARLQTMPSGGIFGFGKLPGGGEMPVDGEGKHQDFAAHDDFVRLSRMPHWPHALRSNGEFQGFMQPDPAANHPPIIDFSLGYFVPLFLHADGTASRSRENAHSSLPSSATLGQLDGAISVASNNTAAAVIDRNRKLHLWGYRDGNTNLAPDVIDTDGLPEDLVRLHSLDSLIFGEDLQGKFHALHPGTEQGRIETLNSLGRIRDLGTAPWVPHWLAIAEDGSLHAGGIPDGQAAAVAVPDDLGPARKCRVGLDISAVQLADGTWRAWGKPTSGVVDHINTFGPEVLDLSGNVFDDNTAHVIWIESKTSE